MRDELTSWAGNGWQSCDSADIFGHVVNRGPIGQSPGVLDAKAVKPLVLETCMGSPPDFVTDRGTHSHLEHASTQTSRYILPESSATTQPSQQLHPLRARVAELEEQLRFNAEEYRAIIAEMANTCRALQARIKTLEVERAGLETEGRKRKALRRRTWHIQSAPVSPVESFIPLQRVEPLDIQIRDSYTHRNDGLSAAMSVSQAEELHFDDAGLLMKAWLWY